MATSVQNPMKEENPYSCRVLSTSRKEPNVPLRTALEASFISITISQPKIRIKMPKLLAKTLQRRNHKPDDGTADDSKSKKKRWAKPRNLLLKKVGYLACSAFGNKKPKPETSSPNDGQDGTDSSGDDDDHASVQNRNGSNEESLKPFPLSESTMEILESEDGKGKQGISSIDDEMLSKQPNKDDKQSFLKVPSSLSGILKRRSGLSFVKGKTNKPCNSGNIGSGEQVSSSSLNRVPSRKIRRARSVRKKAIITKRAEERSEEEENGEKQERAEEELCKKRILMGEKCRPLNLSGALHYDMNGVLLPEELLPC